MEIVNFDSILPITVKINKIKDFIYTQHSLGIIYLFCINYFSKYNYYGLIYLVSTHD